MKNILIYAGKLITGRRPSATR